MQTMSVKDLIMEIVSNCFFVDPSKNEIIVSMYERDHNGCVIDITNYPISIVMGADGNNRICIEKNITIK